MLRRILKILLIVLLGLVLSAAYFGYQFYITGDDYGHELQIASEDTRRQTKYGEVIGFLDITGTHTWMGLPYAKPPIGDLRWKSPRKPVSWQGTLKALKASDYCKQFGTFGESRPPKELGKPIGSEDCLYANIFAPRFSVDEVPGEGDLLPVMVYIHGGGNTAGYANQYKYSGRHLAQKYNVIVVTFNYRLGPFGWFSHPAMNSDASPEDRSGNYGNLDTVRILEWIKSNIEAFGGNPKNVTLFGESAGGMNLFAMLASPYGAGLFHQAIIQSGLPISMPLSVAENYADADEPGHQNSSKEVVNKFLIADGIVNTRDAAIVHQDQMTDKALSSYLLGKSADEILQIYESEMMGTLPMIFMDGTVLPKEDLLDVFSDTSNYNAVPLIVGTNRDEFKSFFVSDRELVEMKMGFLPHIINEDYFNAVTGYFNDSWKARGVDEVSIRLRAAQGDSVFAYRFDWDELPTILGVDLSVLMGAVHASEIPFVFSSFDDSLMSNMIFNEGNTPGRDALSDQMSSYWVEFAYSGKPGQGRDGKGSLWQPWGESAKFIMFDTPEGGGVRMNPEAVTRSTLKRRIMTDTSFPDEKSRSEIYDCMFKESPHWDEEEFMELGGKSCDIEIFEFLRL
ncbi:MAG: carboxylesterase family protein [Pseudomonadales bacterium]|jgi:para-nitrobenzyl esterase|nr:carboxylesterase family protein [Pseudomonadales bacterium]